MFWKPVAAAVVALAVVSASPMADDKCCFGLTAYGGPGGPVRQLSDGQLRIGDLSLPETKFCIGHDGGIVDGKHRGCILTPPTTQWQCDEGAEPTYGFGLTCNGTLTHDHGDTTFYACPTGERNGWNLYSKTLEGEPHCVPAWLHADKCYTGCEKTSTVTGECPSTSSNCASSTSSSKYSTSKPTSSKCSSTTKSTSSSSKCPSSTSSSKCPTSSKASSTSSKCSTTSKPSSTSSTSSTCSKTSSTSSKRTISSSTSKSSSSVKSSSTCSSAKPKETCPIELVGKDWSFPHLIVPVSKSHPDKVYGTVFNGTASPDITSYFNFDIPEEVADKTLHLVFALPKQHQLETSAFELEGDATFKFTTAYPAVSTKTTYHTAPKPAYDFGMFKLEPGKAYEIGSHPADHVAGKVATFAMSAVGNSYLNYFQDYNPCPIGLYIIVS